MIEQLKADRPAQIIPAGIVVLTCLACAVFAVTGYRMLALISGTPAPVAQQPAANGPSPEHLSEEELRQYFLYLKNEKHASRSTCALALCDIKFLYEYTLHKVWPTLSFVRPPRERKLPVVLSQEEVGRILGCLRQPHYRVCLTIIYSCGLRLQEGVQLQVADIGRD